MLSTMERISTNKIKLRIEEDAGVLNEALQKVYLRTRGRFNVPGFRKGKAPRKLIERIYGEGIFHEDALEMLFPTLYADAAKAHEVTPVSPPELSVETIGAESGLVIFVETYIKPEVILGQYKGLAVAREDDSVSDDAVDQAVFAARKHNSRDVEVDDRPVQDDDIVMLDYAGAIGGVAFEGGTAEGQSLTVGSGEFVPGFEEQIIGMRIGDEKDLQVTFPSDYHNDDLAGKDAVFHVKVHEIHVRELPDLDDEFAKDVGYDTLDEYRASVRARLETERKKEVDDAFNDALLAAAAEQAEVDIPEAMIERAIDTQMESLEMQMAYRGIAMRDYFYHMEQTEDEVREGWHEDAKKHVKNDLVLEAIAKAESIEPSQEELDAEIARLAKESRSENNEAFREKLTVGQMEWIRDRARIDAVIKLLRDEAIAPEAPEAADA